MPGPQSIKNTYMCTSTHFCGGFKTGLSQATFYRHTPYHDSTQPSFSPSFQNFLDNSAGNSQSGQDKSQGNTDGLEAEFPTSPQVLDSSIQDSHSESTTGVNLPF